MSQFIKTATGESSNILGVVTTEGNAGSYKPALLGDTGKLSSTLLPPQRVSSHIMPSYQTIATLDNTTNWGAASVASGVGGGSVFNATGGPWGSGCFDWTSPDQSNTTRRDYTAAFKTSGGIGIWIKDTNNFNAPNRITVYVSDAGFTSYMAAVAQIAYNTFCPTGWRLLWIPAAAFSIGAGAPVFEGTTWAKLRISMACGPSGAAGVLSTGPIVSCATGTGAQTTTARLAITMDDGNDTDYTVAFALMEQYGLKGTIFMIPAALGTAGTLTLAQLKRMYAAGWDIAGHDTSSLTWTMANQTEGIPQTSRNVYVRMKAVQDWLLDNGFERGAYHAAYPGGGFDQATLDAMALLNMRTGFRTGPPPATPYYNNRPFLEARQKYDQQTNYTLGRVFAQNADSTTGAIQRGVLTAAIDGKCDMIHSNHFLGGTVGSGISWAAAEFNDFITTATTGVAARVAAGQVQCLTISEMYP